MKFYNVEVEIKEGSPKLQQQEELDFDVEEINNEEDFKKFLEEASKAQPAEGLTPDKIWLASQRFADRHLKEGAVLCYDAKETMSFAVFVVNNMLDVESFICKYLDELNIKTKTIKVNEISMTEYESIVRYSNAYVKNLSNILSKFNMNIVRNIDCQDFLTDKIVIDDKNQEAINKDIADNFLSKSFAEEIKRIYDSSDLPVFLGHPAHYFIVSKSRKSQSLMLEDLISALYEKKRLQSKRYTVADINAHDFAYYKLDQICEINEGATVVVRVNMSGLKNTEFRSRNVDIGKVCRIIKEKCSRVLIVFLIDYITETEKLNVLTELGQITMVQIAEDMYFQHEAASVLKSIAAKDCFTIDDEILNSVQKSDRNFSYGDLLNIYNKWKHKYLGTEIFSGYKQFVLPEITVAEKKCDAYEKLQNMIGLNNVKKVIDGALSYFKLQQEYLLRGIDFNRPAMHMVFTGSPGTAKTTVARLVAQILKDNKILSEGKLVEVGRADLVGEYVGQTAPQVKSYFNKAKGGVLFIDEAYSLMDKKGLYGDEAINTIVQEMENSRGDMVVILAGYKDEMQKLLEWNPGLSSRIAFHVDFDDYSEEELYEIINLLAKERMMNISSEAKEKIEGIFKNAKKDKAFGNGRFARNLLEHAKFNQAARIAQCDLAMLSDEEIRTLKSEDFEYTSQKQASKPMGFGV